MTDLSVLIPSRNEMFLARTIRDLLDNMRADTEIIAVLDGNWAEPPIPQDDKVSVIHYPESIGQRAATNRAAAIASGKYLMKCDAHCAFAPGFDAVLLEDVQEGCTIVPVMRNLHAFDWVCEDGHRRYQGPSGVCKECGKPTTMDVVWIAKTNPQSTSYCFDSEPHFQYFGEYKKRPEGKGVLTETMSLQGSCWMLSKDMYFDLNICDEKFGSWGSQGIEVAVKTWLSGGRCLVDHRTWYAHLFRTQGGDFGFPYPISGRQVDYAKKTARRLFFENKWTGAIHPLSWLVEKFWPVRGWTDEDLAALKAAESGKKIEVPVKISQEAPVKRTKGVVYYTDNRLDPDIMRSCIGNLAAAADGLKIVSVSLAPLEFGENIVVEGERSYLTMFKQILAGLEALDADIVYFAEHDVLYHPTHFEFEPERDDCYYYNTNVWKLRMSDGFCLHYDCQQTSGLCASRDLLLQHYRERVKRTQALFDKYGDSNDYRKWIRQQGFEPGTHGRAERVDDYKAESWQSEMPNVDIRHKGNLTKSRWSKDQFRNQRYTAGWTESDEIPGWGKGIEIAKEVLNG